MGREQDPASRRPDIDPFHPPAVLLPFFLSRRPSLASAISAPRESIAPSSSSPGRVAASFVVSLYNTAQRIQRRRASRPGRDEGLPKGGTSGGRQIEGPILAQWQNATGPGIYPEALPPVGALPSPRRNTALTGFYAGSLELRRGRPYNTAFLSPTRRRCGSGT